MEKFIYQIVQELIELDPEFKDHQDDLHELVEKLIQARPEAMLDDGFRQKLGDELKDRAFELKQEVAQKTSFATKLLDFFRKQKLVYTVSGVAFACLVLLFIFNPYFVGDNKVMPQVEIDNLGLSFGQLDNLEAMPFISEEEEAIVEDSELKKITRNIKKAEYVAIPVLESLEPEQEDNFLGIVSVNEGIETGSKISTTSDAVPDESPSEGIPRSDSETVEGDSESPTIALSVGGLCEYVEISGTAKITSITEVSGENTCVDAMEVRFDFVPDDMEAVQNFNQAGYQKITVGAGMDPSMEWVNQQGIEVGSEVKCIKKEITEGTCTPVIFEFSELDFSSWEQSCWLEE